MLDTEFVYSCFRKAQSEHKGRGYRLPKDWENFFNNRLSKLNRKNLRAITRFFNTKWSALDSQKYFECGFELFNNFTYHQFLDPRVIRLYIQRDKIGKIQANLSKKNLVNSALFVKQYMRDHNIRFFRSYAESVLNNQSLPIKHYIQNKIDHFFLTWLIRDGLVQIEDEKSKIPYIMDNYRASVVELREMEPFLRELREKL